MYQLYFFPMYVTTTVELPGGSKPQDLNSRSIKKPNAEEEKEEMYLFQQKLVFLITE